MALAAPRLCCLDLDTFFVSVERIFDPSLEGKPVVVGGRPGQRGVVTAASYEVRAFGVRSGLSLTEAFRLAPHAVFLPTRHGVYGDYAKRVRTIADRYSPVIRTASIDEMYIDFAGCERLYQRPGDNSHDETVERVVRELTAAIRSELGLPASAGIAASKCIAKVASGLAKPAGVLLVPAGSEPELLAPLSVRKFPGIGPAAERKLAALGITTLGELAQAPRRDLARIFGAWTDTIRRGIAGQGAHELGRERPAFQEYDPSGGIVGSISNERTFREDVRDPTTIESMLCGLCERVCWRARKRGVKAGVVTLKLRYADFDTLSRSRSITPTSSERELYPVVMGLYRRARKRRLPIRLLGLALSKLRSEARQLELFENFTPLDRAVDGVRRRHGFDGLGLALSRSRKKHKR